MVALRAVKNDRQPSPVPSEAVHPFGALLRQLRERIGLSQNRLARAAGIDGAYVNRLERAGADSTSLPRRGVVLALANTLEALDAETEQLLILAGHCPESIMRAGRWEPVLGEIVETLADSRLDAADLDRLRDVLQIMVDKWRPRVRLVEG